MGRLINGINGAIQGKIGTISGSSWKGIPYVKGPHKKRTAKISELEIGNRKKFAAAHHWLYPILKFVREGFKGYSKTVEGFNAAKSYLLRNAFEGVAPDLHINPALMKVSYGNLPLSSDIAVTKLDKKYIKCTWNPATLPGGLYGNDQAMILAYDIEHADPCFKITGQFRKVGEDTMLVAPASGRTFHIYFAFVASDRKRQSDSVYLGTITG